MPELPEVQTVINVLKSKLLNKKIENYKIIYDKMIENPIDFEKIKGLTINDITRCGKFIIFDLGNLCLVSHLRMEGKYFIKGINDEIVKHEHVVFYFDEFSLRYHDVRKFGIMLIRNKENLYITPPLNKVALDPFSINYLDFHQKLNKKKPIKELLLDQSIVSGLGNIYVDEVLYKSNILPTRLGIDITIDDSKNIIENSKIILNKSIEFGGTTIRSYTSSLGVKGNNQVNLFVHTKDTCPKGHKVLKMKIGGRTTYYCQECQK